MTKSKAPSSINCIHGLRAMSIFWIILGHRVYNHFPWGNPQDFRDFMNTPSSVIIKTHPIAVDTFLVLGAVFMTWAVLRDCEKGELNIGRMIWRRYLRYTPAFAALILFVVSISKYFVNGPFPTSTIEPLRYIYKMEYFSIFTEFLFFRYVCTQTWWLALLHIQNYAYWQHMCLSHSWYLSADFQLFVISPFIIYAIFKYGKKFLSIPMILFGAIFIYIISISSALGIPMPSPSGTDEYFKWIYYPTQSRAGPWFLGMLLGYFMYYNRGLKFKINWALNAALWTLTFSVLISILFLTYNFTVEFGIPQWAHTTFMSLQRNLWGVCICWIIFACQHLKTGGIVRWFLSLPHWQPIGRMGLSMYLIHPVYQVIAMTNQRAPLYMNFWQFVSKHLISFLAF
jgi:peptidoglycan/LPS O-acetylase OafA/YrhL